MTIHDALRVEAPESEEKEVRHLVQRMMITAGSLSVPLEADMDRFGSDLSVW